VTLYASVDWGGSKFRALLLCDSNAIHKIELPAANLRTITDSQYLTIRQHLNSCQALQNAKKVIWLVGAAGANDEKAVNKAKENLLAISPPGSRVKIYPDYLCNHAAGFSGKEGIISVNGTGSFIYAQHNKQKFQAGGWGFVLDESPSGAYFGRLALQAVLAFLEGNHKMAGIAGHFTNLHYKPERKKILNQLYRAGNMQNFLGSFAIVLTKAADEQDKQAESLIDNSFAMLGKQLVWLTALMGSDKILSICGCGGLWQNWPTFEARFSKMLKKYKLPLQLKPPKLKAVVGPLIYYARNNEQAKERLALLPKKEIIYEQQN
jgi:N-acetylglucosamine kinase-like BadF-type ATPase